MPYHHSNELLPKLYYPSLSANMIDIERRARLFATARSSILISGETGTGKDILARHIHAMSSRGRRNMVAINCAAIPSTLLESELFGHEKGAFSGALNKKIGKIEAADKTTLLLDEIGELEPTMQAKLLRVLQEREFERIGGILSIQTDFRLISITNRNLREKIDGRYFRDDLYFRLSATTITIPPLRDRPEDLIPLAQMFLSNFAKENVRSAALLSPSACHAMKEYSWPGNVRELENMMARASLLCGRDPIKPEHLEISSVWNELPPGCPSQHEASIIEGNLTWSHAKRTAILKALAAASGRQRKAAALLGISPRTLRYHLRELNYGFNP